MPLPCTALPLQSSHGPELTGRSPRRSPWQSRTTASGSATTLAPEHTTCTRSTAMYHAHWPLRPCTRTWQPDTVLDSGPSMYVSRCVHVANFQVIRVVEIPKTEDVKRPYIRQLLTKNLKFPLPHRVPKLPGKKVFSAQRPSTW
jgi:hypothetical protein